MERILIVDDHDIIRKCVRTLLSARRHTVCAEAANGREALDQMARITPDLVILDPSISGMPGAQVLHQIRASWPSIKVVLFTLHDPETLRGYPADDIICKNEASLKLENAIDKLLSESDAKPGA